MLKQHKDDNITKGNHGVWWKFELMLGGYHNETENLTRCLNQFSPWKQTIQAKKWKNTPPTPTPSLFKLNNKWCTNPNVIMHIFSLKNYEKRSIDVLPHPQY